MTIDPSKLAIEIWDVDKLVPYAGNAKKHPPEQIDKIVKSVKAYGWNQPITVDKDGVIIAGHGRRLAAIQLGMKRVPVVVRRDLTKEEADALRLADNRVTSTEYDARLVQEELSRLHDIGFDLDAIGFDARELEFLTADLGTFDETFVVDDIAEAVEEQKAENRKHVDEVDEKAAPIVDAFGFKRVTISQSRRIRNFMSQVEKQSGKQGAEALLWFLTETGY